MDAVESANELPIEEGFDAVGMAQFVELAIGRDEIIVDPTLWAIRSRRRTGPYHRLKAGIGSNDKAIISNHAAKAVGHAEVVQFKHRPRVGLKPVDLAGAVRVGHRKESLRVGVQQDVWRNRSHVGPRVVATHRRLISGPVIWTRACTFMPTATRRKAPLMYHRRLWLIATVIAIVMCILLAQATRLTMLRGDVYLKQAQARLSEHRWLPTWRGTIFDRKGRVLVADAPRWEVAVPWDVITGQWAEDHAVRDARAELGRGVWQMASPETRLSAIRRYRPKWDVVIEDLWERLADSGGVPIADVHQRVNDTRGRVQRLASVVWDQQRRRHEARFGDGQGPEFTPRPIAEQVNVHALMADLSDVQAAPLQTFAGEHPDLVSLRYARDRVRPQTNIDVEIDVDTLPTPLRGEAASVVSLPLVASGLVGTVRDTVWSADIQRRPLIDPRTGEVDRGGYRTEDRVGARGVERAWEDTLRGELGVLVRDRDDDHVEREEPIGGHDVHLTIDAALQARVEAILHHDVGLTQVQLWHGDSVLPIGTQLPASVVVLDIPTGEILAMASVPSLQDGQYTQAQRDALHPWLIRPLETLAPPGSIVKPLVLAAAVTDGSVQVDEIIECKGHHFEGQPELARCWIYRPRYGMSTHGPLGAVEAMARSCNSWFYELGDRLGARKIADWMGWFGMDQQFDVGISPSWSPRRTEVRGLRPDDVTLSELTSRGEDTFESVMMGIGQGRTAWTPLHAANAYATLVRGGQVIPPTLVRGWEPASVVEDRQLDPRGVAVALAGLEDVVAKSYGTAHHITFGPGIGEPIFDVSGVRIAAKTGTAQAPPWKRDANGDGEIAPGESVTGLEHAWVVALVGDAPRGAWQYAIAVLVENGGSGGRVAGPIANQVIRALQAQGYVKGDVSP